MLSVALFSVLATAQADSMVVPCRPPTISASQPSPGQTDVPLDAFVQMVVRDYCDKPLDIAVDVELRKGDEIVERISVRRDVREEVSLFSLRPLHRMSPIPVRYGGLSGPDRGDSVHDGRRTRWGCGWHPLCRRRPGRGIETIVGRRV